MVSGRQRRQAGARQAAGGYQQAAGRLPAGTGGLSACTGSLSELNLDFELRSELEFIVLKTFGPFPA